MTTQSRLDATRNHRDHYGDYRDLLRCHDKLLEAAKAAQYVIHGFHCGINASPAWEGGCAKECSQLRAAIAETKEVANG